MLKKLLMLLLSVSTTAIAGDVVYSTSVPAGDVVSIDAQGNVYAAGIVIGVPPAGHNIAITKLDPSGRIVFTSFLAGSLAAVNGLAVDSSGNVYITGTTAGDDLTVTPGVLQEQRRPGICIRDGIPTSTGTTPASMAPCSDAFLAKFDASGKLVFSTYLGGSGDETGTAIAVDNAGFVYVTGTTGSDDFPLQSALQPKRVATMCTLQISLVQYPCSDSFIAKLAPDGTALAYSTYLGGNGNDTARGIAVDDAGIVYVAGQGSPGFPITNSVFHDSCSSRRTGTFAFVTKLNPAANSLVYSGCVGTSDSPHPTSATAIALDASNQAYVVGFTESDDLAITPGAFQSNRANFQDIFALKISADGDSVLYSTYLGGRSDDFPTGLAVDAQGRAVIGGRTTSDDFPIRGAGLPRCAGRGFVTILSADGTDAVLSGYTANDIAFAASADDAVAGASLTAVQKITGINQIVRPELPQYCVVGGADFIGFPASITPGEVMTLFGRGLGPVASATLQVDASGLASNSLAGTRVLLDGAPTPLLYVQDRQINFAAPYALAGKKASVIQVDYQGRTSDPVTVPVRDLNPSIFRSFSTGLPMFVHEDGTLDSSDNPVATGSVITFFTTGTGQTDPPSRDGEIGSQPAQMVKGPVGALIQGVQAEVLYAGAISGIITAVQEFQVRVPPATGAGIVRFQIVLGSIPFDIGNIWVRGK